MLDFGWPELFLIVAIAIIVIGPNEIPAVMVALGRIVRRFQYIKFAISQQFDDVMRDADLDDIRKSVNFEEKPSAASGSEDFDEAAADEEYAAVPERLPESKEDEKSEDKKEGVKDD